MFQQELEASEQARLYTEDVHIFNGVDHIDLSSTLLVEVGSKVPVDQEKTGIDYVHTFQAAVLLGLKPNIGWLATGQGDEATRRMLIGRGFNKDGSPISFENLEEAQIVIKAINAILQIAEAYSRDL